jgi:hypothetical protein
MNFRKTPKCMFSMRYIILLIFNILFSIPVISQRPQTICLSEIPQKQVQHYIKDRDINYMQNFSAIHASWKKESIESAYRFHERIFYIKKNLAEVWGCYRHSNPVKSWNTHFIKIGLLISKCSNSVTYVNNCTYPEIDTGQVVFVDLKLIKGLFNVPLAFEITNIDPILKILEFSYIEGNTTQGKQTVQFFDNGDGRTRIVHLSYFKSYSPFRDKFLYPHFHSKFIKEFHRNMKHELKNYDSSISHDVLL